MKKLQEQILNLEKGLTAVRGETFVDLLYQKHAIQRTSPNFMAQLDRLGLLVGECCNLATTPAPAAGGGAALAASTSPVPLAALRVLAVGILGSASVSDKATTAVIDAAFFAAGLEYPGANWGALEARCGPIKKFGGFARTVRGSRQAKIDRFFAEWARRENS
ncbi:MAG: hypothetical protein HY674_06370 [Chloroflexi bacterium]|nr:hypothetical protein [Chloroflexota bacterium]